MTDTNSDSPDPYRHHPELRGKIADPMSSRFRRMDLSEIDQMMFKAGAPKDWRISDEVREANRREALRSHGDNDLWLFGYGSLIWDPGIRFSEVRIATLSGYHRRFCIKSELGRGSIEKPGMMVCLDQGGECRSLAFRIPREHLDEETRLIWQREMLRRTYAPTYVTINTKLGPETALTFVIDPCADSYRPDISLEQAANYVATGEGFYGSSFEYVNNLVAHLAEFGIEDENVCQLHQTALDIQANQENS
jgi:cation transport protein ChaC